MNVDTFLEQPVMTTGIHAGRNIILFLTDSGERQCYMSTGGTSWRIVPPPAPIEMKQLAVQPDAAYELYDWMIGRRQYHQPSIDPSTAYFLWIKKYLETFVPARRHR